MTFFQHNAYHNFIQTEDEMDVVHALYYNNTNVSAILNALPFRSAAERQAVNMNSIYEVMNLVIGNFRGLYQRQYYSTRQQFDATVQAYVRMLNVETVERLKKQMAPGQFWIDQYNRSLNAPRLVDRPEMALQPHHKRRSDSKDLRNYTQWNLVPLFKK